MNTYRVELILPMLFDLELFYEVFLLYIVHEQNFVSVILEIIGLVEKMGSAVARFAAIVGIHLGGGFT
jgi:hypothetical protein